MVDRYRTRLKTLFFSFIDAEFYVLLIEIYSSQIKRAGLIYFERSIRSVENGDR